MNDAAGHGVLRHFAEVWALGWSTTRSTARPKQIVGGVMIEVSHEEQHSRYILWDVSARCLRDTMSSIGKPRHFIKACAPRSLVEELLDRELGRWTIDAEVWMMAASQLAAEARPLPSDLRLFVERDGALLSAVVTDTDGVVAAHGRAALGEDFLVFDQIVTSPDHRRKGLGTAVMTALSEAGVREAPRGGLLVATEEGARLYEVLGWSHVSPVTSLVIP